jgi:hypothetical protein
MVFPGLSYPCRYSAFKTSDFKFKIAASRTDDIVIVEAIDNNRQESPYYDYDNRFTFASLTTILFSFHPAFPDGHYLKSNYAVD